MRNGLRIVFKIEFTFKIIQWNGISVKPYRILQQKIYQMSDLQQVKWLKAHTTLYVLCLHTYLIYILNE